MVAASKLEMAALKLEMAALEVVEVAQLLAHLLEVEVLDVGLP